MSTNSTSLQPTAPGESRRALLRPLLVAVGLAIALATFYFSPVRPWLRDTVAVRRTLASLGLWAYPACVLATAFLVACGAPRLLLAALGAMALGFWWGLVLTQTGAILGYYAMFLFVRWGGREWVLRRRPRLQRWADLLRDQGAAGVFLFRQLPVHGTLTNFCLGLSGVSHSQFLAGSALGVLPEAVPVALVAAGLVRSSLKDSAPYLAAAAVALAVVWIACGRALRSLRNTRAGAALISEVSSTTHGVSH